MDQPIAELALGRSDSPSETIVSAWRCGQVTVTVQNTEVANHACDNELTLAQAIQLRDFLNRHIDDLALKQAGSLAVRSSDDPGQLAAVEEVTGKASEFAAGLPVSGYASDRYRKD